MATGPNPSSLVNTPKEDTKPNGHGSKPLIKYSHPCPLTMITTEGYPLENHCMKKLHMRKQTGGRLCERRLKVTQTGALALLKIRPGHGHCCLKSNSLSAQVMQKA